MSIRRKFLEGGSTSVSTVLSNVDQSLPNFIRSWCARICAIFEDYYSKLTPTSKIISHYILADFNIPFAELREIECPIFSDREHSKFLLLARYVPNVTKRSIWDQCIGPYIDDRSATGDRRPTTDRPLISKNSNGHIAATDHLMIPIHFMFGSRVGFLRRMALFLPTTCTANLLCLRRQHHITSLLMRKTLELDFSYGRVAYGT